MLIFVSTNRALGLVRATFTNGEIIPYRTSSSFSDVLSSSTARLK